MLHVYTGANRLLGDELVRRLGEALAAGDAPQYIVVPRQLTLMTERMVLDGLKLRGSFRIRVLSPARLCGLIFEAAGFPGGVRVDERGRVMLVRRAIQNAGDLTIYKHADRRRGFAERCARQMEVFMQGGVTAEALEECADASSGMTAMKLRDLAAILREYSALSAGQYQDGEMELTEGAARAPHAAFVAEGQFWFFGFDLMPPTLMQLMAQVSAHAAGAELFYPLSNDEGARDRDCYRPMERALARLGAACAQAQTQMRRSAVVPDENENEILHLSRELYAYPLQPSPDAPKQIRISIARDVREECMLAAAQARKLAMEGMRYGDMQLICADLDGYRQNLVEAFRIYEVPLFLSESRPVSRMATAECLLSALRMIEKNFRSEDVFSLMRTGYTDLSEDESDRLANYAVKRGIEGKRWLRSFTRGTEAEIQALEPLRRRLIEPVSKLKAALKEAKDLPEQLAALFGFLTDVGAYERSLELQKRYEEQGMRETAGALSQAWNRIIGALDQMAALMGEKRLPLRELSQNLTEALEAAVVKPLPQSGDAVYAQSTGRMLMQKARALFVLGMADKSSSGEEGLLTPAQKNQLAQQTRAYLGPDEADSARIRRFYLKESLGMAADRLFFSCSMSGADGSAQRPGMEIELVREIFPGISGGSEEETKRLLLSAPMAAINSPDARAALRQISDRLPDVGDRIDRITKLLKGSRDGVDPASARSLYGRLQYQSITRLERFAQCPFSYFVQYGLRPEKIEPFELDRRDEGSFLHEAVHEFLRDCGADLSRMEPDAAEKSMGIIADRMLANMRIGTAMEDSASARAEMRGLRAAACRCARVLTEHMRGSSFTPSQLERSFGREDGENRLRAGDTILEGRIDRVDEWPEGNSLRVIDFKLGGKALDLAAAYHGLQLQLPVYLGAALRQKNARSAGVYYFPLEEGVVNSQSTDPHVVEQERAKAFRMSGLLPEDMELVKAQAPNPEQVFAARMRSGGGFFANVPCADDKNFDRLIRHAVRTAEKQIAAIRAGETAASPASLDRKDACEWCDYRAACLFDPKLNAKDVRRLKNYKWNEVFEKLAMEEEES